jgi:hypothetical protein
VPLFTGTVAAAADAAAIAAGDQARAVPGPVTVTVTRTVGRSDSDGVSDCESQSTGGPDVLPVNYIMSRSKVLR